MKFSFRSAALVAAGVALAVFDAHEALMADEAVYVAAIDAAAAEISGMKAGWRKLAKQGREIASQIPTANGRAA